MLHEVMHYSNVEHGSAAQKDILTACFPGMEP